MKMLVRGTHKSIKGNKKKLGFSASLILIFAWPLIFLVPAGIINAQSISMLPGMKSSSGIIERIPPQDDPGNVLKNLSIERASVPVKSVNKVVTLKRTEGSLQKSGADAHSQILRSQFISAGKQLAKSQISDSLSITVPYKLEVLSKALISQKIKGLAALKQNKYTSAYLAAIGVDLGMWIAAHSKEQYFSNIFKIQGPWVIMLLAMSPTSMHEYVQDLDLPSNVGDILEANKLPSNLTVDHEGDNIVVEVQGAGNLWITFRIDKKDQVSVVIE